MNGSDWVAGPALLRHFGSTRNLQILLQDLGSWANGLAVVKFCLSWNHAQVITVFSEWKLPVSFVQIFLFKTHWSLLVLVMSWICIVMYKLFPG